MARTWFRVAGVVAVVGLVAGCSGSDGSEASTSTSATTTAAETTAAPETTADTTSTTTSTTEVTTTEAPPTTLDGEAALIAQVEQAYFDAYDAYHEAIFDPSNEELRAGLAEHYVGRGLENVLAILDDLVELRAVARENPQFGPSRAEITGPVRFTNDERTEASIVVCELNAEWFVEPESGPDGEDSVMRTDIIRSDLTVLLQLVDGQWRQAAGGGGGTQIGVDSCD